MRDERGIILNWLVKFAIALAIGGVILFDAGSIAVNYFGLDSAADEVANQIATDVASGSIPETDLRFVKQCVKNPTANDLCRALETAVKEQDARLIRSGVDQKGTLKIRLRRTADTLVVSKIGFIEDWATTTVEGRSSTKPQ
ncbi:MAG: hypothetical protein M3285_07400 [Actinomycetota bacterium]|nr:hypothetical protein [Actinomycetota bacterium]